ncbi:MAG TPA: asparagine synthase (glutamine-hydrolyzing) [Nitrospiria bacterium]|nr:asparagine synthase (glutamine-hydrolyzing) [Nitrospiria bacterium]
MCGICGFVGLHDEPLLRRMTQRLVHRGPDDQGFFLDGKDGRTGVGLGMRRLSIIDLDGGRQPIANEDGSIRVVFNGEIYNYRELRQGLLDKGHIFSTQSDTEVIVHLYEEHGEACVEHLQGMFAFALWDEPREQLVLARDRLGIKPLYYAVHNGTLLFASELKALLECDAIRKTVEPQAIAAFLTFLYIPSPDTIFAGVRKLPPGHVFRFRKGEATLRPYWTLSFPDRRQRAEFGRRRPEDYCEELRVMLEETVRAHQMSDVPLGLFLSGGLDSGGLAAIMARQRAEPVQTFTVGYGDEAASYNELEAARVMARHIGSNHHEEIITPNVMVLLPKLVWHLDEPFADSSLIPTYLVSMTARRHVTVALTGIGGDELFGGYPRYLGARLANGYERLPVPLRRAAAGLIDWLPESTGSRNMGGRIKRFVKSGLLPARERYLSWISFYDRAGLEELLSPSMKMAVGRPDSIWEAHRRWYDHAGASNEMDHLFATDVRGYLADDLLMLADKMSMAASLELRVPYCDHRLIEYAAAIPGDLKVRGLTLKALFRRTIREMVPAPILNHPKQGFMVPIASWLNKELKPLVNELLSESAIDKRGYFNSASIRRLLEEHESGRRNCADQLFALLVLELWHRIYIDGERW